MYASFYNLIAIIIGFALSCILAITTEVMKRYAKFEKRKKDSDEDDGDFETLEEASVISDICGDEISD